MSSDEDSPTDDESDSDSDDDQDEDEDEESGSDSGKDGDEDEEDGGDGDEGDEEEEDIVPQGATVPTLEALGLNAAVGRELELLSEIERRNFLWRARNKSEYEIDCLNCRARNKEIMAELDAKYPTPALSKKPVTKKKKKKATGKLPERRSSRLLDQVSASSAAVPSGPFAPTVPVSESTPGMLHAPTASSPGPSAEPTPSQVVDADVHADAPNAGWNDGAFTRLHIWLFGTQLMTHVHCAPPLIHSGSSAGASVSSPSNAPANQLAQAVPDAGSLAGTSAPSSLSTLAKAPPELDLNSIALYVMLAYSVLCLRDCANTVHRSGKKKPRPRALVRSTAGLATNSMPPPSQSTPSQSTAATPMPSGLTPRIPLRALEITTTPVGASATPTSPAETSPMSASASQPPIAST